MKIIDDGTITKKEYDALNFDDRMKYWQLKGNNFKLIADLDDDHLQRSFCYAQSKELLYYNKYNLFDELTAQIEAEAGRRGLPLSDLDTDYHKKLRKFKSKIPNVEKVPSGESSDKLSPHP